MKTIYLDNAATTKPFDIVVEKMIMTLKEDYGNPSSLHRLGIAADRLVKDARINIANSIGAKADNIYFTSGGTEGNNWAIIGAVKKKRKQGNHIITTQVEHPSVMDTFKYLELEEGYEVDYLPVSTDGTVKTDDLKEKIRGNTILVSIMQVNNETGAIQPIKEIGKIVKEMGKNILLHVDGVQGFGKVKTSVKEDFIDFYTISGHKIGGPKGVGAIYIGNKNNIEPLFIGGGQETGLRSGTENVHSIAGLGTAVGEYMNNQEEFLGKMLQARNSLLGYLKERVDDFTMVSRHGGAPHILNLSFPGIRGEILLHCLEDYHIYVSTGSACSSSKKGQSYVLSAMGLEKSVIEGAIRFSFSPDTPVDRMDYVAERIRDCIKLMGKRRK